VYVRDNGGIDEILSDLILGSPEFEDNSLLKGFCNVFGTNADSVQDSIPGMAGY